MKNLKKFILILTIIISSNNVVLCMEQDDNSSSMQIDQDDSSQTGEIQVNNLTNQLEQTNLNDNDNDDDDMPLVAEEDLDPQASTANDNQTFVAILNSIIQQTNNGQP
jgi:hypothetical protein